MILTALHDLYERLSEPDEHGKAAVPPYGYAVQRVGLCLMLEADGTLVQVRHVKGPDDDKGKTRGKTLFVPEPPKRSVNVAPGFLFDKTAYVLGREANQRDRTAEAHGAFKALHEEVLADTNDEGLLAVLRFLWAWSPDDWDARDDLSEDDLSQNVVFRLASEQGFVHDRPAARAARAAMLEAAAGDVATCLVTGEARPAARLHPAIKGVAGAQSSGASLASFNLDAFKSYGREQGDNAPVGECVAAGYAAALNHLLSVEAGRRYRVGDASMVFWADTSEAEAAAAALVAGDYEDDDPVTAGSEEKRAASVADAIAQGRPLEVAAPDVEPDTKLYVLGLSPNAARLSVRFWETPSFGALAERFRQHADDLALAYAREGASPRPPAVWQLGQETGAYVADGQGRMKVNAKSVSPRMAGDLMRALLRGDRYPRTLLTSVVMRLRTDRQLTRRRMQIIKACLVRDARFRNVPEERRMPVALDEDYDGEGATGYRLGRLFAEIETMQRLALGDGINATVRDKFYGAASTTPARIFPALIKNAQNHFAKAKKSIDKKGRKLTGLAIHTDKRIGAITASLPPVLPSKLGIQDQGAFAVGYYHQSYAPRAETKTTNDTATPEGDDQ